MACSRQDGCMNEVGLAMRSHCKKPVLAKEHLYMGQQLSAQVVLLPR